MHHSAQRNTAKERIVDQQVDMLIRRQQREAVASEVALDTRRSFSTLATIDGWDVVDANGRQVDHRDTLREANGVAFRLNNCAASGPDALVVALGGGRHRR